jgi:hypothetical protein
MTNRLLTYALILGTVISCQKGPDDPMFSLSTRKARITGEWKVESFSSNINGFTEDYNGESITYSEGDTLSYTRSLEWSFDFAKDGTYHILRTEEFEDDLTINQLRFTLEESEKGIWEFSGGNDSPSKSKLLLLVEEIKSMRSDRGSNVYVISYDNPRRASVFDIVGLSNEELKISFDETQAYPGGSANTSENYTMKKFQ